MTANKLTPDEVKTLGRAPFLVFTIVAAADGNIDQKEIRAFSDILATPHLQGNSLLSRAIQDFTDDIVYSIRSMQDEDIQFGEELLKIREILDTNFDHEEAQAFKTCLMKIAVNIADASGGFLGMGNRICKHERIAIALIGMGLDVAI